MVAHLPYLQNAMHTFWHNKHAISALLKLFCVYVGKIRRFAVCSLYYWQSVSSRRGRFIVPAYTNTPTKWQSVSNILADRQQL